MSTKQPHGASSRMRGRRHFLQTAPALAAACTAALASVSVPARAATALSPWCATWGTAPAGPPASSSMLGFSNQTHLHPNDAGYQAMAQAIPLSLFT